MLAQKAECQKFAGGSEDKKLALLKYVLVIEDVSVRHRRPWQGVWGVGPLLHC